MTSMLSAAALFWALGPAQVLPAPAPARLTAAQAQLTAAPAQPAAAPRLTAAQAPPTAAPLPAAQPRSAQRSTAAPRSTAAQAPPTAAPLSAAQPRSAPRSTAAPRLTAAQVIEKSIEAAGGRAALAQMTTTLSKGFMRIKGHEEHSLMEFYAKAPNKRLVVTNIEGFGETRQGFDGAVGWRQDATGAVAELRGQELAAARSEAAFNPTLRWRDVYTKAVLKGKAKVGARDAWVVVFTEKNGTPATRYYDAETFLLVRQTVRVKTAAGPLDITVDLSDYRDAGAGVKAPFRMTQKTPGFGEITVEMTEIRNNAEIEDAIFAKPAPPVPDKK